MTTPVATPDTDIRNCLIGSPVNTWIRVASSWSSDVIFPTLRLSKKETSWRTSDWNAASRTRLLIRSDAWPKPQKRRIFPTAFTTIIATQSPVRT